MNISEITDGEIEAVIDLWRRCGLTRPRNDPRRGLALARAAANAVVLIGRADGELAASAMVGFDGHRGWVYYPAVEPAYRRRGLGRRMMRAAEDWLRDRGAPKIQLMVRAGNAAAIGFYQRLGLEPQQVVTLGKRLDDGVNRSPAE